MTIWSIDNHTRHPWFDNPIKKRKQGHSDWEWTTSSDESDGTEARPAKRQRCGVLEQGLAGLSLQHNPSGGRASLFIDDEPPRITEVPQAEEMSVMDADDGIGGRSLGEESVILPSSVEEPGPDAPEIEMKTSSWYELAPDRIVITDLDSYEAEDENGGENSDVVSINSTLLEHIRKQRFMQDGATQPWRSQALVLFRPLIIPNIKRHEQGLHPEEAENEDKMDVGP